MNGKLRETVYLISLALTKVNYEVNILTDGLLSFSEQAMEHIFSSKAPYASSTLKRFCLKTHTFSCVFAYHYRLH